MRLPFVVIVALLLLVGGSTTTAAATDPDGDGLTSSFEVAYGLNPQNADGDRDGLLDPAEDPDHDGLSNLGEQRFGTDPTVLDSDGDGKDDGADDADGDGTADWRQQDARAVPDPITPSLSDPNASKYCYRPGDGTTGKCTGDPNGKKLIAIYGDSHAGHWIAGLQVAALRHHWRLKTFAMSGCPSAHVKTNQSKAFNAACRQFRRDSERALAKHPPRLVIITNYSRYRLTPDQWRAGLGETLAAMPSASRVVVLGDTPQFAEDVPACLQAHLSDVGACEISRANAYRAGNDQLEASVAADHGAGFVSMNPWVCPYRLCPVVVGHFLMWRDLHHLTARYSKQLAPALARLVAAQLS